MHKAWIIIFNAQELIVQEIHLTIKVLHYYCVVRYALLLLLSYYYYYIILDVVVALLHCYDYSIELLHYV